MVEDSGRNQRVDCLGSTEMVTYSWNMEVVNSLGSESSHGNSWDIEKLGCLHDLIVDLKSLGSCGWGNSCLVHP
jgi:hypothetical protein